MHGFSIASYIACEIELKRHVTQHADNFRSYNAEHVIQDSSLGILNN